LPGGDYEIEIPSLLFEFSAKECPEIK